MKHALLALLLLLCLPLTAFAQASASPSSDVARAEAYLNNLTAIKARFLQTAPDGSQKVGTFYLNRPGRLRFTYDNSKDFVVADGYFIYFYDSDTKQQTNAPIGQTLADFLLRKNIAFKDDLSVKSVDTSGRYILITVVQTKNPTAGSLTLAFTKDPFALKKWRVVDGGDAVTEVELFQLQRNPSFPPNLFSYMDPEHGKVPQYNQ